MSTTLRRTLLKTLDALGVKSFKARSGLSYPFICHVGDFAGEVAFYNRAHSRMEVEVMARWCAHYGTPLVFDVGANVGFVATQLAQAVRREIRIVAFEPVHHTFSKLTASIERLGLQSHITPLCCIVSDRGGELYSIACNPMESLFAQVRNDTQNSRTGNSLTWSSAVTLDAVAKSMACSPVLIKIDVEGYEAHVLRGARCILQGPDAPLICFELNPLTLKEVGSSVNAVTAELSGYRVFYLDDFEGQRLPLGKEITDLETLTWVCNLIAAPPSASKKQISTLFE